MNLPAADAEIQQIEAEVAKGQGFLVALLSGRLTSFISMGIAGFVAIVLCLFLLWHPDNPHNGGIITILGIIGGGAAGVGNITSIFHTFIANKTQPASGGTTV